MASNQVLSPMPAMSNENYSDSSENIVYLSPTKFKMRLLKRLVSVESNKQDLKTASIFKRTQSENGLQASIVLPNGEIGTIYSLDKTKKQLSRQSSQNDDIGSNVLSSKSVLPVLSQENGMEKDDADAFGLQSPEPKCYRRPLKLPPIMLPSVYSTKTYPLGKPDLSYRPPPAPITDEEWEELKDCRYLRPAPKRFRDREISNRSY
ncbi:unnamed protein product [Mytilus coruscus]|uniref:Uncharacterized protein n=1 Tax=Mytilus coruscus TaxID=42192 RepID=A0A6J8EES2_MYTCO|nr:unnamed protein product [Mytilus coruscus]